MARIRGATQRKAVRTDIDYGLNTWKQQATIPAFGCWAVSGTWIYAQQRLAKRPDRPFSHCGIFGATTQQANRSPSVPEAIGRFGRPCCLALGFFLALAQEPERLLLTLSACARFLIRGSCGIPPPLLAMLCWIGTTESAASGRGFKHGAGPLQKQSLMGGHRDHPSPTSKTLNNSSATACHKN